MKQHVTTLNVSGSGPGLHDITGRVRDWLGGLGAGDGVITLYIPHTSASLTIQENADPDVARDLEDFFGRLVSRDPVLYRHTMEGPDDMPAHIRTALTQTSLSIPVRDGALLLGTWQGIYLFEHRDKPHRRKIHLTFQGN